MPNADGKRQVLRYDAEDDAADDVQTKAQVRQDGPVYVLQAQRDGKYMSKR